MTVKRKKTSRNQELRAVHVKWQKGRCFYCYKRFRKSPLADTPTLEHIIPLWQGGYDKLNNTCAACWQCNQDRNKQ